MSVVQKASDGQRDEADRGDSASCETRKIGEGVILCFERVAFSSSMALEWPLRESSKRGETTWQEEAVHGCLF